MSQTIAFASDSKLWANGNADDLYNHFNVNYPRSGDVGRFFTGKLLLRALLITLCDLRDREKLELSIRMLESILTEPKPSKLFELAGHEKELREEKADRLRYGPLSRTLYYLGWNMHVSWYEQTENTRKAIDHARSAALLGLGAQLQVV